jgi:hypothetical protein
MRTALFVVLLLITACGSDDDSVYLDIEEKPVPIKPEPRFKIDEPPHKPVVQR